MALGRSGAKGAGERVFSVAESYSLVAHELHELLDVAVDHAAEIA